MKFAVGLAVLFSALALGLAAGSADSTCAVTLDPNSRLPVDWIKTMKRDCGSKTREQIQAEIGASYVYLKIAAYFSRDTVNRPGFADFFFKAAREERDHAIQLIQYLSMRGTLVSGLTDLTTPESFSAYVGKSEWTGVEALKDALELETAVTAKIRNLITTCETAKNSIDDKENINDYHFVDYLTGVYLEEQHKGQREIAGKLATLTKMYAAHGKELAEFLFDKEL